MAIEYTKDQEKVARLLLNGSRTLEEIREETGIDAGALNEALKGMQLLKVLELSGNKYRLIKKVTEAFDPEKEFEAIFLVEGGSPDKESLAKRMKYLEDKIKQSIEIVNLEAGEPIQEKEMFTSYIEFTARFKGLHNLIDAIVNFGPSSVEVLKPNSVTLNSYELQKTVSEIVSTVHYYAAVILNAALEVQRSRDYIAKNLQTSEKKPLENSTSKPENKE